MENGTSLKYVDHAFIEGEVPDDVEEVAAGKDVKLLNSLSLTNTKTGFVNFGGTVKTDNINVNLESKEFTLNLNAKHDGKIGSFRFDRTIPSVFANRETELEALRAALDNKNRQSSTGPQLAIIHGIGGVGKSTLARWYATLHENDFVNFVWIDAQRVEAIGEAFRSIWVSRLEQKHIKGDSASDVAEKVYQKLLEHPTLIVFDNTENGRDIAPYLPKGSHASNATVIATTRVTSGWTLSNFVPLGQLTSDVCEQYIRKNLETSPISVPDIDTVFESGFPGWRSLAEEFEYLIIGVESATNAIVQRNRLHKLLGEKNECYTIQNLMDLVKSPTIPSQIHLPEHPQEITCAPLRRLWAATLDEIEGNPHGKLRIWVLSACAFLAPAGISLDWLRRMFSDYPKEDLAHALGFLHNWSLAHVQDDKLVVHRLLQKTMVTRLHENRQNLDHFLQWLLPQVLKLQRHLPRHDLPSSFAFSSSFTWLLRNLQPYANQTSVLDFLFRDDVADFWHSIRNILTNLIEEAATGKVVIPPEFYPRFVLISEDSATYHSQKYDCNLLQSWIVSHCQKVSAEDNLETVASLAKIILFSTSTPWPVQHYQTVFECLRDFLTKFMPSWLDSTSKYHQLQPLYTVYVKMQRTCAMLSHVESYQSMINQVLGPLSNSLKAFKLNGRDSEVFHHVLPTLSLIWSIYRHLLDHINNKEEGIEDFQDIKLQLAGYFNQVQETFKKLQSSTNSWTKVLLWNTNLVKRPQTPYIKALLKIRNHIEDNESSQSPYWKQINMQNLKLVDQDLCFFTNVLSTVVPILYEIPLTQAPSEQRHLEVRESTLKLASFLRTIYAAFSMLLTVAVFQADPALPNMTLLQHGIPNFHMGKFSENVVYKLITEAFPQLSVDSLEELFKDRYQYKQMEHKNEMETAQDEETEEEATEVSQAAAPSVGAAPSSGMNTHIVKSLLRDCAELAAEEHAEAEPQPSTSTSDDNGHNGNGLQLEIILQKLKNLLVQAQQADKAIDAGIPMKCTCEFTKIQLDLARLLMEKGRTSEALKHAKSCLYHRLLCSSLSLSDIDIPAELVIDCIDPKNHGEIIKVLEDIAKRKEDSLGLEDEDTWEDILRLASFRCQIGETSQAFNLLKRLIVYQSSKVPGQTHSFVSVSIMVTTSLIVQEGAPVPRLEIMKYLFELFEWIPKTNCAHRGGSASIGDGLLARVQIQLHLVLHLISQRLEANAVYDTESYDYWKEKGMGIVPDEEEEKNEESDGEDQKARFAREMALKQFSHFKPPADPA